MPKFRGPGPADDFCPIASLYALKALNQDEETRKSEAAHSSAESLLRHWEERGRVKHFLFGIGTDYKKLKYPRIRDMGETVLNKADPELQFFPESMYRFYKEEDFANKKEASPTLTVTALPVLNRVGLVGVSG